MNISLEIFRLSVNRILLELMIVLLNTECWVIVCLVDILPFLISCVKMPRAYYTTQDITEQRQSILW